MIVELACNFNTITGPIRVTSDVNCTCLPMLLPELSQLVCLLNTLPDVLAWVLNMHYVCLFNTWQMYSHRCSIGTIDTMEI